jgi:lipid-binding SYLF domain-containing protein
MARFNMRRSGGIVVALVTLTLGLARLGYASDADLIAQAQHTLALYQKTDPGIAGFMHSSAGYAVFPTITKGGFGIGGAHGTGVVFERGQPIGKTSVTQVTVGAQAGGQQYSQVIFFQTPAVLADFKAGKSAFAAQASAVAVNAGAAAQAGYKNGVAIFTGTTGGLMAEASIGGQKFSFEPFAAPAAPK